MDWRRAIDARAETEADYRRGLEQKRKEKRDAEQAKRARHALELEQARCFIKP